MSPDQNTEQPENSLFDNTRRQFVAGTAGALGGLAAGSSLVAPSLADEHEEENGEEVADEPEEEEMPDSEFEDDIDILNYALTLEYLEADFYRQALENISEEQLCTCGAIGEDSALAQRAYAELQTIQTHEQEHAQALAATIEDLGGTPVDEPEFEFGLRVEYPFAFLATAVQLEDLGVAAYAGAAPYIENPDVLPSALGIHSVEARHAAFVRTLANETSFPETVDQAQSRTDVLAAAAPFIVGEDGDPDEDVPEEPDEPENGEPDEPDEPENGEPDEPENGEPDEPENGEPDEPDEPENGEPDDTTNNGEQPDEQ